METTDYCYFPGCANHQSPLGEPKDPRPTYAALLNWKRAQQKYRAINQKPPPLQFQKEVLQLFATAETVEDYLDTYFLAEFAGMGYWTDKGEFEWTSTQNTGWSSNSSLTKSSKEHSDRTPAHHSNSDMTTGQHSSSPETGNVVYIADHVRNSRSVSKWTPLGNSDTSNDTDPAAS